MEAKTPKGQTPSLISTKYDPPYCTILQPDLLEILQATVETVKYYS